MKVAGKIIIRPMGEYDAATTYGVLDMVTIGNKLYVAKKNGLIGIDPVTDNNVNWKMLIDGSADLKEFEAAINQQITALESNVDQQVTEVNSRVNMLTGDPANYSQLNPSTASKWGFTYDDTADGRWYTMETIQRDCYISDFYDCLGGETMKFEFEISTSCMGTTTRGGTDIVYLDTFFAIYGFDETGKLVSVVATPKVKATADAPVTSVYVTRSNSKLARKFRICIQTEGFENFSGTIKVRNISISKVRALEDKVDNIQVGGRNLLSNTMTFDNTTDGLPKVEETYRGLAVRGGAISNPLAKICEYVFRDFNLDETYTFSFYAKGTLSNLRAFFYGNQGYVKVASIKGSVGSSPSSSNYADGLYNFGPLTDDWKRYWVIWKLADTGDVTIPKLIMLRADNSIVGETAYVCGVKFEKGNIATDWTPAPEDVEAEVDRQITAVNDKIDNIQVGGRNLVRHSYITNANCTTFTYDEATNTWDCVAPMGNAANKCGFRIVSDNAIKIPRGRTFIVSFEVKSDVDVPWRCDVNNRFDGYASGTNDNDDQTKRKTSSTSLVAGRWTKVWFSYTAKEDADYDLCDANSFWSIVTTDCEADVHLQFRNVMGELATIPSEYTPAPEDITSDIAMAQSTADSAQTDANTAKSMANNASQGANAAISDAANALSKAQEALDKAAALEEKINNLTMTINTTTGNLEWRME